MIRSLTLFFLLAWLKVSAQSLLPQPYAYVPGAATLIVDVTDRNIVMQAMSVNQHLAPEVPLLAELAPKQQHELFAAWQKAVQAEQTQRRVRLRRGEAKRRIARAEDEFSDRELSLLFLQTGSARIADALDSLKQRARGDIDNDTLAQAAAQRLLNSITWACATADSSLCVNFYESSVVRVATPTVHCDLDIIIEEGRIKLRISGVVSKQKLTLRLRLPKGASAEGIYHNGRRVLRPHIDDGYFIIARPWRNNEEIYFDVPTSA